MFNISNMFPILENMENVKIYPEDMISLERNTG